MRTLIISDLHLGGRLQHGLLTRPEPLSRLLDALDGIDRLVLLGDTVELVEGRPHHAMQVAEPVLRAIGGRMGDRREVAVVPGNHDAPLVRAWVRAQGSALRHDSVVEEDATPALARLVSWLAPARVRVRYPGIWLSENVWATHGHYLDQHLLPVSAWGFATRGLRGRPPRQTASPSDYEAASRPAVGPLTRLMPRPMAALLDDVAELARASTMPRLSKRLINHRVAPVTARLLGAQMRRASIPALVRVVHRLGIDAEHVVFGHVHRLGPLPGDDPSQWQGRGGPRLVNTGSWVYEPLLLHRARPPHPYWPGGAVLLEPGEPPRVIGLLDELPVEALH